MLREKNKVVDSEFKKIKNDDDVVQKNLQFSWKPDNIFFKTQVQ